MPAVHAPRAAHATRAAHAHFADLAVFYVSTTLCALGALILPLAG